MLKKLSILILSSLFVGVVTWYATSTYWEDRYNSKPVKIVRSYDCYPMIFDVMCWYELTAPILDKIETPSLYGDHYIKYKNYKLKMRNYHEQVSKTN